MSNLDFNKMAELLDNVSGAVDIEKIAAPSSLMSIMGRIGKKAISPAVSMAGVGALGGGVMGFMDPGQQSGGLVSGPINPGFSGRLSSAISGAIGGGIVGGAMGAAPTLIRNRGKMMSAMGVGPKMMSKAAPGGWAQKAKDIRAAQGAAQGAAATAAPAPAPTPADNKPLTKTQRKQQKKNQANNQNQNQIPVQTPTFMTQSSPSFASNPGVNMQGSPSALPTFSQQAGKELHDAVSRGPAQYVKNKLKNVSDAASQRYNQGADYVSDRLSGVLDKYFSGLPGGMM